jgi:hypothetical protein
MLICGQKRGPFDKATLEQLSGALSKLLEAHRASDFVLSENMRKHIMGMGQIIRVTR